MKLSKMSYARYAKRIGRPWLVVGGSANHLRWNGPEYCVATEVVH